MNSEFGVRNAEVFDCELRVAGKKGIAHGAERMGDEETGLPMQGQGIGPKVKGIVDGF